ncbi:aldo/keto reductase [Lutimonas sp.]|uniref:aldo/keto reductase n=1 Tax=Lutimonas sp. TaxID=1872403 RepID=UPI003D9ADCB1
MEKRHQKNGINRRSFLQRSSTFSAGILMVPMGVSTTFGFQQPTLFQKNIPVSVLNNGVEMPMLGFGTNTLRGELGVSSVQTAISVGYRLIDTAKIYGNEESVGMGIKNSGVNREALFVTSKLWVDDTGYENTLEAFELSLNKLGLDYLDLYLIHRPRGDLKGSWKAMEELHKKGKIKAIGVSNFDKKQMTELMSIGTVKPAVNQIETHVFFQQHEAHTFMKRSGIQMEAWSPFAAGRNGIFTNGTIADIGKKYNKRNAQVCLRWLFQRGIVSIPRSSNKAHMIENLDIFDFELSEDDMKLLATLDLNKTQFPEWE